MTIGRLIARLAAILSKKRLDRELENEIAAHLELAQRDAAADGFSAEQARLAARRRFGGIEQMKEEHRDSRGVAWMDNLLRDFRYGLGSLRRTPGFTAIVVAILGLGIGANVAMFSLVDAVLLKPLPFPNPDRIVRVWEAPRPGVTNATSTLDFLDWKRMGKAFESIAAEIPLSAALTGNGDPVRLPGKAVTADYFRVFGVGAFMGRTFAPLEDQAGAGMVVVLSHAAWQTHFGGDAGILNRSAAFDGQPYQIIGVLPPGPFDRDTAQFWKPLVLGPERRSRGFHWLSVHGRLTAGVTLTQAREQMRTIQSAVRDVTPFWKRDWTIVVEPLDRLLVGDSMKRSAVVAFGAVLLVLLIACANVANLLLARGAARRKEMAIRTALGASRGRLAVQLLTEGVVLCLFGGAAGLALASLLIQAAAPVLSQSIPHTASLVIDFRVFAFAASIALGVGLLVSVLPSLQSSTADVERSLRETARGSSRAHHNLRGAIVVAEVTLSLVLVCGALLLFKSLFKLQQLETGIRMDNVITMSLSLPLPAYPTPEKAAAFYESLSGRMATVPGILQSGLSSHLPLRWIGNGEAIAVPGIPEPVKVRFKRVDPGYFGTLGIPLLAGRGIDERDRIGARRVMVINEALAGRLADVAGLNNPVGHVVRLNWPRYVATSAPEEEVEIAGIIRSERVSGPGSPDPAVVYVPLAQVPNQEIKLIVRAQSEPASIVAGIRDSLRQIDPNLPLGDVETIQQIRDRTLSGSSRPAWLIGVFASIAALLTAVGLYGVISHEVSQQRREIGIRMALGARPGDVVSQVLKKAMVLVAAGLGLGSLGALALTRVMKTLLFEVSPFDPFVLAAACAAMMLVGLLAGSAPASRAARIDPVQTLRDEG